MERMSESVGRQVVWGTEGTLARFRFAKDAHVAPHRHPAEQFTCVVSGLMRLRVGGDNVTLRAGDMLVIPPLAEHEVWVIEETEVIDFFSPARADWLQSEPAYLKGARQPDPSR